MKFESSAGYKVVKGYGLGPLLYYGHHLRCRCWKKSSWKKSFTVFDTDRGISHTLNSSNSNIFYDFFLLYDIERHRKIRNKNRKKNDPCIENIHSYICTYMLHINILHTLVHEKYIFNCIKHINGIVVHYSKNLERLNWRIHYIVSLFNMYRWISATTCSCWAVYS